MPSGPLGDREHLAGDENCPQTVHLRFCLHALQPFDRANIPLHDQLIDESQPCRHPNRVTGHQLTALRPKGNGIGGTRTQSCQSSPRLHVCQTGFFYSERTRFNGSYAPQAFDPLERDSPDAVDDTRKDAGNSSRDVLVIPGVHRSERALDIA